MPFRKPLPPLTTIFLLPSRSMLQRGLLQPLRIQIFSVMAFLVQNLRSVLKSQVNTTNFSQFSLYRLGILVFLLLYRYICWYCKRKERNNARQNEDDGNSHVVNLMVSYNNRSECTPKDDDESSDPPPLYNVAIHLPKPSNTDEVPTYEQALAHQ
ncbi:uncharacterized protein LOC135138930 isoform X2 [Zophobas morio]